MSSYEIGMMIKKLRTQKGMSQEELAHPIINRETLSRIESGKVTPHSRTMRSLFERLGYDPTELLQFHLTADEVETKRIEDELYTLMALIQRNKPEINKEHSKKIHSLIAKLENNKEYMEKPLNTQYVLKEWALYHFYLEEDENAMEFIYKALRITIPTFDITKINEYHLTRCDHALIITLALIHRYTNRNSLAIDILYKLKENEKRSIIDMSVSAKKMTITIRNLAHILCIEKRAQELFDLCEEGMEICHKSKEYLNYRAIAWYKAKALFLLGRTDDYIELAKKVYHAMDLYQEENNKNYVRKDVLTDTGVDLALMQ
ncbi:MAG: helix-turn-helix transcriptional regulator [Defluviitaleaceae bacterium]|nr:helix-turn-helix transcriptional regulator [Defluviitaleaceae bacterium]